MTIRYDRPVSHAAYIARRLGQFALALFLTVLLAHRFGLMITPYFVALMLIAAAVAAYAVFLALIGILRLWQVGARGGGAAVKAIAYAVLPIALVGFGAYDYFRFPPLYDISTDLIDAPPWLNPPQADQIWLPRFPGGTDQDREAQLVAYPGLTGRRYDGAIDRVYQAAKKVADQQDIVITTAEGLEKTEADIADLPLKPNVEEEAVPDSLDNVPVPLPRPEIEEEKPALGRASDVLLQGEIRTMVLGLRFDTMIRLREEAETTSVDIRVASRYGQHDLSLGARIAESYLRALDAELLGIAGD